MGLRCKLLPPNRLALKFRVTTNACIQANQAGSIFGKALVFCIHGRWPSILYYAIFDTCIINQEIRLGKKMNLASSGAWWCRPSRKSWRKLMLGATGCLLTSRTYFYRETSCYGILDNGSMTVTDSKGNYVQSMQLWSLILSAEESFCLLRKEGPYNGMKIMRFPKRKGRRKPPAWLCEMNMEHLYISISSLTPMKGAWSKNMMRNLDLKLCSIDNWEISIQRIIFKVNKQTSEMTTSILLRGERDVAEFESQMRKQLPTIAWTLF